MNSPYSAFPSDLTYCLTAPPPTPAPLNERQKSQIVFSGNQSPILLFDSVCYPLPSPICYIYISTLYAQDYPSLPLFSLPIGAGESCLLVAEKSRQMAVSVVLIILPWTRGKHTCVGVNGCLQVSLWPCTCFRSVTSTIISFLLKRQIICRSCNWKHLSQDPTRTLCNLATPTPQNRACNKHILGNMLVLDQGREGVHKQSMDLYLRRKDIWIVGSVCLISSSLLWRVFQSMMTRGGHRQAPALEDTQVVTPLLTKSDSFYCSIWIFPTREWCLPKEMKCMPVLILP